MTITPAERDLLENEMRKVAPGYRMFSPVEFRKALISSANALQSDAELREPNGGINEARLMRKVITDVSCNGYGVPFPWWWIAFESHLMIGIIQDPWSEVKWWLWHEIRGKGQVLNMWGCQNCLAPETPVRMFDGSTKRADAVRVGDFLMGDDSRPREVKTTCSGMAQMVRVTPKVGKAFVCTENHLVTVKCKRGFRNCGGTGGWSSTATPGRLYDITANDLMKMGVSRAQCYGLTSSITDYPERQLECDPYIYGLWLGDGTKTKPEITGLDGPVLQAWISHFKERGYKINVGSDNRRPGTKRAFVSNGRMPRPSTFLQFIRTSVRGSKFIRREYLVSSRDQRLQLLAGLIDTDGCLSGGIYYVLTCSDPLLMDGYEELANSLGFRTTRRTSLTNYIGKSGKRHITEHLSICGDISMIPVKMPHKKKVRPEQARGVRKHGVTGFTIERIGIGDYSGFEVDGNQRFLLGDYTVTHNSGKTSWMGRFAVVQMVAWLDNAQCYVSGPYKEHTEDKAWAALKGWSEHLRKTNNPFLKSLGVQCSAPRGECIISDIQNGRTAIAKFVALENASSIQGKKAIQHEVSGMMGITLLILDEMIENPNLQLKQAESNISSNFNFTALFASNPLPEKVQHVAIFGFAQPIEVMNLQRDIHFRWRTAYGLTVRFCWANCPNKILGRTLWPYLLSKERMERQRMKGSDVVDSQIDAWGFGSGARGAPLDEAAIRMAGSYQEPVWAGSQTRIAAFDLAFGGEDPATACIIEAGDVTLIAKDGKPFTKRVLSGVDQIIMNVDADFHATQDWLDEMEELFRYTGGGFPRTTEIEPIKPGDRVGGAWHCAYQCLKTMVEYQIPNGNVTFDSSQRGDCTSIMLMALGHSNVKWFYEGSRKIVDEEALTKDWFLWPYQYEKGKDGSTEEPRLWSEHVSQVISMVWLFACNFIKHGYLVNGNQVKKGLVELQARPIVRGRQGQGDGRRDVLGKEKLKDMGQKSPTFAETLAIGIYFAVRFLGLVKLEGPKLSTTVAPTISIGEIIRGGHSMRFKAPQRFFANR